MVRCNICDKLPLYKVQLNCGEFISYIFYCQEHIPKSYRLTKINNQEEELIKEGIIKKY